MGEEESHNGDSGSSERPWSEELSLNHVGKVAGACVLIGVWRAQVALNKAPHPCQFLAWRKYKQNSPKGSNKISQ